MSKLNIALFTGNYNHIRDGVSLTLNKWVDYLQQTGANVLVFGPTVDEPALDHAGTLVPVPSIKAPGRPEYRITLGLPSAEKNRLQTFDPDIVHIATPDILGYQALKWAKEAHVPIVSSYHTHFTSYLKYYNLQFAEGIGWKYLHWFYDHCSQIYVPTPSMAEELHSHGIGSKNGTLKIWARGVDTSQFTPGKRDDAWRREHGFSADDVVITFVSRLVWEKNLKLFADVVRYLEAEYPAARSMIVGDGPVKDEIREMLPDTLFTGFLTGDELAHAYAGSDIFFFPSDTETFGNVTLEAMASGLPCLVADAAGSKSLVDHGRNGYRAPVDDEGAFRHYASKLVESEDLRHQMSKESVKKSKEFTWQKINGDLLKNYQDLLN
ncbi:MAG: glycosyltransferase [Bacteroidetes bacterium]|jgi:glycosyltransferase involved in cell wall biosynthesis|nr:glycosyltransferase [Bacteroidota bacterium]